MTWMGSSASPLPILFIPSAARPFLSWPNALPGEKNGSSFPIHRPTNFAPFPWPGPAWPSLILFWLWVRAWLCYGLATYNSWPSSSGSRPPTVRRSSDMVQQVTAQHLSRLACLYVRQSTLQQVLENTESTARQYALQRSSERAGMGRGAHCRDRSRSGTFGRLCC